MVTLLFVLACSWSIFCAIFGGLSFLIYPNLGFWFHQTWGDIFLKILGIRLMIQGKEKLQKGGMVIAPNHESFLDILVIAATFRRFHWILKRELAWVPFIGWCVKAMGCYFLRRDGSEADRKTLMLANEDIRKGENIVIFPEGTRSESSEMRPLKKGAFRTAIDAGAPLYPVWIEGTHEIMPKKKLPQLFGGVVKVLIGEPLHFSSQTTVEEAMERYLQSMVNLKSKSAY